MDKDVKLEQEFDLVFKAHYSLVKKFALMLLKSGQDAVAYLDVLQDIIRELDAQSETVDYYIPGVTVQSKGITF